MSTAFKIWKANINSSKWLLFLVIIIATITSHFITIWYLQLAVLLLQGHPEYITDFRIHSPIQVQVTTWEWKWYISLHGLFLLAILAPPYNLFFLLLAWFRELIMKSQKWKEYGISFSVKLCELLLAQTKCTSTELKNLDYCWQRFF